MPERAPRDLRRAPLADQAARARLRAAPRGSAHRRDRERRRRLRRAARRTRGRTGWRTASACRRPIPRPRARRSSSRSSSTSTARRPSRCARRFSTARAGGPRRFAAAGFIDAFRVEVLPRGREPARRPLQRHQLGASTDARLVLRHGHHRPAHRRDRQGRGAARLAARASGPADLRRPGRRRPDRQRRPRTTRS